MISMSVARFTLGGIDVTQWVIGSARVSLGRSVPGSIKTELRAGLIEVSLDNSNARFTKGAGELLLHPGVPLSIHVDEKPVMVNTPITSYGTGRQDGYSIVELECGHTLYRLTQSKDVTVNLIAGRRNAVIKRLVELLAPGVNLTFDKENNDPILVKANNAYDALVSLLQTERKILRETPVYGELELIGEPTTPRFHWYDNEGYKNNDAMRV